MTTAETARTFRPLAHAWVALPVLISAGLLYVAVALYVSGSPVLALAVVAVAASLPAVYLLRGAYVWRYLYPGLLAFAIFVLTPLIYTVYISFTNYSGANLLTIERVRSYLEQDVYAASDRFVEYRLHRIDGGFALSTVEHTGTGQVIRSSGVIDPQSPPETPIRLTDAPVAGEALPLRDVIAQRPWLRKLQLQLPEGIVLRYDGLRRFAHIAPRYEPAGDGYRDRATGGTVRPDGARGIFVDDAGQQVGPGFRTWVGLKNYSQLFTTPSLREPLLRIFAWTVSFATLSVLFSGSVGVTLGCVLNWELLRGRAVYRTLLILPYAVPAFISILIFRDLFNPNFGGINELLSYLTGRPVNDMPQWTSNPWFARVMVMIVNTWLGYPYMMIVATGMLQTVSSSMYEAADIDGAGVMGKFRHITLPSILPPMLPLLVGSFAFNFNNFLLIYLLTAGGPSMPGVETIAGETDLLVTYTFRIAFRDAAANFGYASAIAAVIFVVVGSLAYLNLRLSQRTARVR